MLFVNILWGEGRYRNALVKKICTTLEDYIHPVGYTWGVQKCMVPSEILLGSGWAKPKFSGPSSYTIMPVALQCNLQFTTTAKEDPPQLTTDFTMRRSFSTQIDLRSTTTLKTRPRPLFCWHKYITNISLFTSNDDRLKNYPIIYVFTCVQLYYVIYRQIRYPWDFSYDCCALRHSFVCKYFIKQNGLPSDSAIQLY
jgi:hypothetical protein